jgi:hypothetical protein
MANDIAGRRVGRSAAVPSTVVGRGWRLLKTVVADLQPLRSRRITVGSGQA